MTEDKRDVLSCAEIGEPVPTEHTLGSYDDVVSVLFDGIEKALRPCAHIAVEKDLSVAVQDTDVYGSGVKIDTAIEFMFLRVESHRGLLSGRGWILQYTLSLLLRGRPQ